MIKNTIHGIPVSDDTLTLDDIKEIGHGGHFLMHEHTLQGMRNQSKPELIDRRTRDAWNINGATNAYERTIDKVKWILKNHNPKPLPDEVLSKIRSRVEETEKEMGIT